MSINIQLLIFFVQLAVLLSVFFILHIDLSQRCSSINHSLFLMLHVLLCQPLLLSVPIELLFNIVYGDVVFLGQKFIKDLLFFIVSQITRLQVMAVHVPGLLVEVNQSVGVPVLVLGFKEPTHDFVCREVHVFAVIIMHLIHSC